MLNVSFFFKKKKEIFFQERTVKERNSDKLFQEHLKIQGRWREHFQEARNVT